MTANPDRSDGQRNDRPIRVRGYHVRRLIGRGGSAEVWYAESARTGLPAALKWVPVTDPGSWALARIEAAVLAGLDHPNLLRLTDVARVRGAVVLVFEYAAGGSAADLLATRGRLGVAETRSVLVPIASALAHAHSRGVCHGDVSVGNILFSARGLPLLGDFGLARVLGDAPGTLRATPASVDPAVARGGVPVPASDVFALAAVAVHLLSGTAYWPGDGPSALARAAGGVLPDLSARLPDVDVDVRDVLSRALRADPAARCTAAELALDLAGLVTAVPIEIHAGRSRSTTGASGRHRPGVVPASADPPGLLTQGARLGDELPPARRFRMPIRPWGMPGRTQRAGHKVLERLTEAWRRVAAGRRVAARRRITVVATSAIGIAAGALCWSALRPVQAATGRPPVDPVSVLRNLDAVRAAAFAHGDPAALENVYGSGPALTRDQAVLRAGVPAGCSLVGVHTSYTDATIERRSDATLTVDARATLAPSELRCPGSATLAVAGATARVRISLTDASAGWRITDITDAD